MSDASHTIGTPESFELGLRLGAIFLPHAKRQTEKFYTDSGEIKAAAIMNAAELGSPGTEIAAP